MAESAGRHEASNSPFQPELRLQEVPGLPTQVPFQALPIDHDGPPAYLHGPDSTVHPDVPTGKTYELLWESSRIYPGTSRKVWIHVPACYTPEEPAGVMVFNDGWWYFDPAGEVRGGVVLDNLNQREAIPCTIGVFVDPGVFADSENPKNRNSEYDAFDDRYVTLLLDEILPLVAERFNLSDDPERWGICGGSSGGNAAFTAAWMRPDRFRRVVCFLSSFVQMPDGNPYPELVPRTERKPLRIFQQAARRDLNWNAPERNWFAENLRVAAALAESGYDFRLVVGDGGHSVNHGGVLLPDALKWVLGPLT